MTLKDIDRQLKVANSEKDNDKRWSLLPRVCYKDLPRKLRAEADKVTIDEARRFLLELYPVGALDDLIADREGFNSKIAEALHAARYLIERVDTRRYPCGELVSSTRAVSLIGEDFITAWESVTGCKNLPFRDVASSTRATAKRAEEIGYPIDKMNSVIWGLLEGEATNPIAIAVEKRGSEKELSISYSINFEELGDNISISKQLLPFDKRVYIAVSALFNAGSNIITLTQIHYAMGNTTRPTTAQLKRINNAIAKMSSAVIDVTNQEEIDAGYNYQLFKYKGSLLPIERIEASVNGQITEAAIHIFREPPAITFATQRNQISTIPAKLLQSPLNKTDSNLLLEDYLLQRISHEKRAIEKKSATGKATSKIRYKTIYDHAGITTAKQIQRAPEKIWKYLDYYKQMGFISDYTRLPDGVDVSFRKSTVPKNRG